MDITAFILLLIFSAFFSSSETAFLSLGKIRTKRIEKMDTPQARRVKHLLSDPHKLLITILIGNTLVNIAASAVLVSFFYNIFGEAGVAISIVVMTLVVLIFGEVTPKMLALTAAQKMSFAASGPLEVLERIFSPIRIVLSKIAYGIVKGVGLNIEQKKEGVTEQEIRSLLHIGKKKGVVKEKEKDMIDGILEFKDLNAADIMTPRIDVEALDLGLKKEELVKQIKDSQFSRYPAYVHSLDNIVGIIHSKDFLLHEEAAIKDLVDTPFVAPESMKIDDLLQALQKRKMHMAIVTDEYGVTSGVVTIEDILEEIVGEIRDELDIEKPNIKMIDQKTFEVEGQTHIDEVNEALDVAIETDEVDTIGGYVILCMGKIPQSGDHMRINGFLITVNDVSKNRITKLTIEKKEQK